MKKAFVTTFIFTICKFLNAQEVIHKDPYDIKKTNISVFMFIRPTQGAGGPQLKISRYFSNRFRVFYNGYLGVGGDNRYKGVGRGEYGPAEKTKSFMIHELETDFHLIDKSKEKQVNVALAWGSDTRTRTLTYTSIQSTVRRILSLTTGLMYNQKRENLYNFNSHSEYYIYDIAAREAVRVNESKLVNGSYVTATSANNVYTNASYTNLLLGLKFKSISANGVKMSGYGKKFNDMHLETYCTLILPLANSFTKDLHTNFSTSPTHRVIADKPKTGFKVGIFHRNSIKSFWCIGGEVGVLPTIAPKYGKGFFITLSMGFSLNFGKITYL